jgi:hypothetical protein
VTLDPGADVPSALFGECSGCFVVSGGERALAALAQVVPVLELGCTGGGELVVEPAGGERLAISLEHLASAHREGLEPYFR